MNVNIILYDDFNMMEACMAGHLFGLMPKHFYVNYYSAKGGIMNSSDGLKVWTEYLIPEEVEDMVVIPGGKDIQKTISLESQTIDLLRRAVDASDRCLLLGNGVLLAAHTGALYRRAVPWRTDEREQEVLLKAGMQMIRDAKIVSDGKFYSCTDTINVTQMCLDVIAEVTDDSLSEKIAGMIGYAWDRDSEDCYY